MRTCAMLLALAAGMLLAVPALSKPPSWDTVIAGKGRFKLLPKLPGAVLDKETGLVWQQDPSPNNENDWEGALAQCRDLQLGARGGWRLPSVEELRSLADLTQSAPALGSGHPFLNVASEIGDFYWTSTRVTSDATLAYSVAFVDGTLTLNAKPSLQGVWCTRGGAGLEGL